MKPVGADVKPEIWAFRVDKRSAEQHSYITIFTHLRNFTEKNLAIKLVAEGDIKGYIKFYSNALDAKRIENGIFFENISKFRERYIFFTINIPDHATQLNGYVKVTDNITNKVLTKIPWL